MTLTKDMLTKSLKKSRSTAVSLLQKLSQAGGLPEPSYEHEVGGSPKRPLHFFRVRFRVPSFFQTDFVQHSVFGSGRCSTKAQAKSLAALEAIYRLENDLDEKEGYLQAKLEEFLEAQRQKQAMLEAIPVTQQIPGVSWQAVPIDPCFGETLPAGRMGRIEFFPSLVLNHPEAFMAAKAITLTSREKLPELAVHRNNTSEANQCYANIRATGRIEGVVGALRQEMYGIETSEQAILWALERLAASLRVRMKKDETMQAIVNVCDRKDSSFGMAKLFASLPKHQFSDLKLLLEKVEYSDSRPSPSKHFSNSASERETGRFNESDDQSHFQRRLLSFREHQKNQPLPIDSVENSIPHGATVTIVRGGTGSGKTTRYPMMLSLFSPTGSLSKVLVAEPRRLACQTAAKRVAMEQGFSVGANNSPIGYAIRFESYLSAPNMSRTIDFCTPGVLLRRAASDPLLADITHLVIDEIHERNADVDLLLALARQTLRRRSKHPELPPLRLILMSATLDGSHWESYFKSGDPSTTVSVVDVPDVRRFQVSTYHLDDGEFPLEPRLVGQILDRRRRGEDCDELLCTGAAELATRLYFNSDNGMDEGSILCFLPGMDEIRNVHRRIDKLCRSNTLPPILYLHSSVSSSDQAKAFRPGKKIILATNIAETSITIPDIKIVIDAGRERQSTLLDSESEQDSVGAVGSQLVTVNISRSSAKQREGRAGRVSAGICYRLYSRQEMESSFPEYATPEMLRMELSQLALHSISLYHPTSGHPMSLLLDAPNPPLETRLRQALLGLVFQGLVDVHNEDGISNFRSNESSAMAPISLTPLGRAVSGLQVSPHLGRMLFLGLMLRAIDPALSIAALLSVPRAFTPIFRPHDKETDQGCSDLAEQLHLYHEYLLADKYKREAHPRGVAFAQVTRIRDQLERAMLDFLKSTQPGRALDTNWNANSHRVAAQVGLICAATPNIAHLVNGRYEFATREVASRGRMHPTSVNFGNGKRSHWYVYHELRATKEAYLYVTTAVSPLDLALFSYASNTVASDDGAYAYESLHSLVEDDDLLFIADQWVPVVVSVPSQRLAFMMLRRLLTYDMLQKICTEPSRFVDDKDYEQIVLLVLSALEQQRVMK